MAPETGVQAFCNTGICFPANKAALQKCKAFFPGGVPLCT